ncbi:Alpha-2-macroglobulin [Trichinella pseudospiralis]
MLKSETPNSLPVVSLTPQPFWLAGRRVVGVVDFSRRNPKFPPPHANARSTWQISVSKPNHSQQAKQAVSNFPSCV